MAAYFTPIDVQHIEATTYMGAAGVVILLWDHILTLPDEVRLVWKARLSIAKVLFLFNRYLVPFAMIVQSHEFSGLSPYLSLPVSMAPCKAWYTVSLAVGMLSIATSNFLILLRLWVIWERPPRLVLSTLVVFFLTHLVSLSLLGYVVHDMLSSLCFDPLLRICIPTRRPKLVMLWTPGILFELLVFLTAVWNALDQPRANVGMTRVLYRDGSLYFLTLFALRLINLMLCVAAPTSLSFLGVFFVWSVVNITLARLVLNLRRFAFDGKQVRSRGDDEDSPEDDAEEWTELPELGKMGIWNERTRSDVSSLEPGTEYHA